jgi:hypothetical protein
MAAAAGILNHQYAAGQTFTGKGATPLGSPTNGAGSASGSEADSAKISANDFLTLLVTEMRNQDPTANTDPNQYINQLVQVNSLEQLININQTLTSSLGSTTTQAPAQTRASGNNKGSSFASQPVASGAAAASVTSAHAIAVKHAPGNLTVPNANPAAQSVAHALDGRAQVKSTASRLPGVR